MDPRTRDVFTEEQARLWHEKLCHVWPDKKVVQELWDLCIRKGLITDDVPCTASALEGIRRGAMITLEDVFGFKWLRGTKLDKVTVTPYPGKEGDAIDRAFNIIQKANTVTTLSLDEMEDVIRKELYR